MALEIFLRMDGVVGGSRNYYHPGCADVASWQWQLPADGSQLPTDQLQVVKWVGMESPTLMGLWAQRSVVPEAEISIVPVVGKRDAQQKFIAMKLEKVRVLSIEMGCSAEDSRAIEKLTLKFEHVRFEFHHYTGATPDLPGGNIQSVAFDWLVPSS